MRPLQPHYAAAIRNALDACPEELSPVQRFVLTAAMLHAQGDGLATVSRGRITDLTGYSDSAVKKALQVLRERGLLGAPVLTSDGSGFRTYRHPILVPWEPSQRPLREPSPEPVDEARLAFERAVDQVPF